MDGSVKSAGHRSGRKRTRGGVRKRGHGRGGKGARGDGASNYFGDGSVVPAPYPLQRAAPGSPRHVRTRGGGNTRGRGSRQPEHSDPVSESARFFCGVTTWKQLSGLPLRTPIHEPLHEKRAKRWTPRATRTSSPLNDSKPSPVLALGSPAPIDGFSPAAYKVIENDSAPSSPAPNMVHSDALLGDCKTSPAAPNSSAGSPVLTLSPPNWPDNEYYYVEPITQRLLPVSRSRVQDQEICDAMNSNNYGSEDSDEDSEDVTPAMASLPRVQKEWFINTQDDEDILEASSTSSVTPQPTTSVTPQSSSTSVMMPNTMWDFNWQPFTATTIDPKERMESFDHPRGPVNTFPTPYDAFTAIWDETIMSQIVIETNHYAQRTIEERIRIGSFGPSSRLSQWQDVTVDEIYLYFAMLLAMGMVIKTNIREYWAKKGDVTDTPNFGRYMSVNRFINIGKVLHFNNNEDITLKALNKNQAKLFKISPIIEHLNSKFQSFYCLGREIALDESLTQWKGWLNINQFIKNKAAGIGIKSYEICDSKSGYLWRFLIHTGREEADAEIKQEVSRVSGIIPSLVLKLVEGLENRGHVLFMDNYYNSPALTRTLKSIGFDVVGTLRTNKQFVPPAIAKLKKNDMKPGQVYGASSGDIDIILWRDQNRVAMISTYHGVAVSKRDDTFKPIAIHDYNVCMGGVDKKDQMLAMYPIERKRTHIWYKKFFRRLLNVSVLNSFILHRESIHPETVKYNDHRLFRQNLIRELLARHSSAVEAPMQRMVVRPAGRFKYSAEMIKHFPTEYGTIPGQVGARKIRRSCIRCHHRTQTHCQACEVALCLNYCFIEHHKV